MARCGDIHDTLNVVILDDAGYHFHAPRGSSGGSCDPLSRLGLLVGHAAACNSYARQ